MSDDQVNALLGQLEDEREKRGIAEWHYQQATIAGTSLFEEVSRLKDENSDLRARIGGLERDAAELRGKLRDAVQPLPVTSY